MNLTFRVTYYVKFNIKWKKYVHIHLKIVDILYWFGIFSFKKKYLDQDYWYFYSHTYNEIVHGLIQVGSSINLSFGNFFVLVRIDKILRPRLALNGSFFNIPKVCMCGHTFENFMLSQPLSLYKKIIYTPTFDVIRYVLLSRIMYTMSSTTVIIFSNTKTFEMFWDCYSSICMNLFPII